MLEHTSAFRRPLLFLQPYDRKTASRKLHIFITGLLKLSLYLIEWETLRENSKMRLSEQTLKNWFSNIRILWDAKPSGLTNGYRRFGGLGEYFLYIQRKADQILIVIFKVMTWLSW